MQPGGPKVRLHGCQLEYWFECFVQFHPGGTTAPHLQDVRVTIAQTGISIDVVRPAINGRLAAWLDVTVLIEGRPPWELSGFLGPLPSRNRWRAAQ